MFDSPNQEIFNRRINVNEETDVNYWAEQFECSPEKLRIAIARVGVNVADVKEHLL